MEGDPAPILTHPGQDWPHFRHSALELMSFPVSLML